jgi:arylsulfatase A-like enzyme
MRADTLGIAGNRMGATPRLDALAREGSWSPRMYCVQPLCMPSRATMITGMSPRGHRVWANGVNLDPALPTIGDILAGRGHATALIGKAHFCTYWQQEGVDRDQSLETPDAWAGGAVAPDWNGPYYGFEHVELTLLHNYVAQGHIRRDPIAGISDPDPSVIEHAVEPPLWSGGWKSALPVAQHPTTWIADRAIAFMREKRGQPFFLWASIPDPHHPFAPSKPYSELFDPDRMELPPTFDDDLEGKPDHVRDYAAGRFATGLEGAGAGWEDLPGIPEAAWRQTLAFYYGMCRQIDDSVGRMLDALEDLGIANETAVIFTSDHGEMLGDHGLLYKGPFAYEGLQRVPFIARLPGAPAGITLEGLGSQIDLAPTFLDLAGIAAPPQMVGAPRTDWLRGGPGRDHALIEFEGRYSGLRSRTLVTSDWKLTRYEGGSCSELYALSEDPLERENLYHDSAYASTRAGLTDRLAGAMLEAESRYPVPTVHA